MVQLRKLSRPIAQLLLLVFASQKAKSQCACHSESAVVRRAAAETDDDLTRTALLRIQDHFTGADGRCSRRVALRKINPPQPSAFAHFHHRGFVLPDPEIARLNRAAERVMRRTADRFGAERIANDLCCAFATIGYRRDLELRIRQNVTNAGGDILRHSSRTERAFEFVGSN